MLPFISCLSTQSYLNKTPKINFKQKDELLVTFDLADVVAREPAGLAAVAALPPAPILCADDMDDVTLGEGQLVLIGLLEVEASLHHQLGITVFSHVLRQRAREGGRERGRKKERMRYRKEEW